MKSTQKHVLLKVHNLSVTRDSYDSYNMEVKIVLNIPVRVLNTMRPNNAPLHHAAAP